MPSITSGTIAVRSTASPSQPLRSRANRASASAYRVPAGYPVSPSAIASVMARATGSGQRYVHLRHPQRQYVLGVGPPLHARTQAQLFQGELTQRVGAVHGQKVADTAH